jgi:hypothetical protein
MSEKTEQTASPLAPDSLQERVDKAYIAKGYTLLNGGTDNIVMIQGERKDVDPVDVLLTYDGMEEVLKSLKESTTPKQEEVKEESSE